jgi:hypothetical protein
MNSLESTRRSGPFKYSTYFWGTEVIYPSPLKDGYPPRLPCRKQICMVIARSIHTPFLVITGTFATASHQTSSTIFLKSLRVSFASHGMMDIRVCGLQFTVSFRSRVYGIQHRHRRYFQSRCLLLYAAGRLSLSTVLVIHTTSLKHHEKEQTTKFNAFPLRHFPPSG